MRTEQQLCYLNGEPYRPVGALRSPVIRLRTATIGWSRLWEIAHSQLRRQGYCRGTLLVYRHVLRRFKRHAFAERPGDVTAGMVRSYLCKLRREHCSASWLCTNITVLRTLFDKLGGMGICTRLVTPKRPRTLPDLLDRDEVALLISATPTIRDRLIMGLLYGCGLRVGELCRLRWSDFDIAQRILRAGGSSGRCREVMLPGVLLPILARGVEVCAGTEHVFPGSRQRVHLSERMVERIVARTAREAEIGRPVCCMSLRHSYAVQCLRDGVSIRDVQESLGHRSIKTTMRYLRCLVPAGLPDPLGIADISEAVSFPGAEAYVLPDIQEFPFADIGEPSVGFRAFLKAHLTGRFLALRRFACRTGGSP